MSLYSPTSFLYTCVPEGSNPYPTGLSLRLFFLFLTHLSAYLLPSYSLDLPQFPRSSQTFTASAISLSISWSFLPTLSYHFIPLSLSLSVSLVQPHSPMVLSPFHSIPLWTYLCSSELGSQSGKELMCRFWHDAMVRLPGSVDSMTRMISLPCLSVRATYAIKLLGSICCLITLQTLGKSLNQLQICCSCCCCCICWWYCSHI